MAVKKVIFRLREQDEETQNAEENPQEQPAEEMADETLPDETLAFDALINMITTVRDNPGVLAMDDEDKREIWPVVKRSLAKYAGRLQGMNLDSFRNYFRS